MKKIYKAVRDFIEIIILMIFTLIILMVLSITFGFTSISNKIFETVVWISNEIFGREI